MAKALESRAVAGIILGLLLAGALAMATRFGYAQTQEPGWTQLTPEQQSILAPLRGDWDNLDPDRRKRWIGLAARYPSLPPERQQRIQKRMREWVALTPEQRAQAIERYNRMKKLPPEKHEQLHQRWREYQDLPEEQRRKLRDSPGDAGK